MICIHWTFNSHKKETLQQPSTPTTELLRIYISTSLLITLTVTKSWRCCRKKANLSPLFLNPHLPTSSLPEACNLCSSELLYAPLKVGTFQTNSLSLPSVSTSSRPLSNHNSCQPLCLASRQHSLDFWWHSMLVLLRHTTSALALLSLILVLPPYIFADTDCSHNFLAPKSRP